MMTNHARHHHGGTVTVAWGALARFPTPGGKWQLESPVAPAAAAATGARNLNLKAEIHVHVHFNSRFNIYTFHADSPDRKACQVLSILT